MQKPSHKKRYDHGNLYAQASSRGVFSVRRKVAKESYSAIEDLYDILHPEITNAAELSAIKSLGVTVVGFSRFDERHCGAGPRTASISEKICSTSKPLEVGIGKLALFGSSLKARLALNLVSEELKAEANEFETLFAAMNFPLKPDYNGVEFTPHCSLALIFRDRLGHFTDNTTMNRLNLNKDSAMTSAASIILEPAR